jgi:hypothetical protein
MNFKFDISCMDVIVICASECVMVMGTGDHPIHELLGTIVFILNLCLQTHSTGTQMWNELVWMHEVLNANQL